ncbi:MAG: hypothetical protein H7321_04640 [Bacteroidia bacterium]|nr:hypothetical protein [Bacteroidia bacterium]
MEESKVISGSTEQEIWSQLQADLFTDILNYNAVLKLNGKEVSFYMDIDLGGGFEGGSEFMQFKAPIHKSSPFRFAIHDKNFVDVIGKFFGMMDVEVGYEDLDKHLIIKTNEEQKVRALFADQGIREAFTLLTSFDCGIHMHHSNGTPTKQAFLELHSNQVLKEPAEFRKIFDAFYALLSELENA